jgi:shikimate dehydrogenase
MHNAAYQALGIDAVYVPLAVAPENLRDAVAGVRALGFMGVNVTVPHKQAVVPLCEKLDESAAAVGAVNTIVDGIGYNTDVDGFRASLDRAYTRAVVLGAGGAARAVVAALAPTPVTTIARSIGNWTEEHLLLALEGADLLVDATSAGLDDAAFPVPIPLAVLAKDALVCSLIYHREPALLQEARAQGLRTLDGLPMLVHQAARAFELMTGRPAPLEVMAEKANAPHEAGRQL